MDDKEVYKGLAGVPVDYTAISKVSPETNSLLYRGYPVQQLAAECDIEDVAYLIWYGELPTPAERERFVAAERHRRGLDEAIRRIIDELPLTAHPMDVTRTAVSALGARATDTNESVEAELDKALGLFAAIPSIISYDQRRRRGQEFIAPRADLGFSANFLYQTFGVRPERVVERAFDVSLILYAEHSFNASTFTARVVTSTQSDLYSAVTAAVGALKGPLHGGANEAVMRVFSEIGSADRVSDWLDAALASGRKVMGFGHRVYKNGDSRVPTMKAALDTLIAHYDRPELAELYAELEREFVARKGIYPNLDYPSGPAYALIGFDIDMFTPLFVAARVIGWTAHVIEQRQANTLIRPLSVYSGVAERAVPARRAEAG